MNNGRSRRCLFRSRRYGIPRQKKHDRERAFARSEAV